MPYYSPDGLWQCRAPWSPVPDVLLLRLPDLGIPYADAPCLLAIVAHGRTCHTWPIVAMTWRQLSRATGLHRDNVKKHCERLRALGIIDYLQPLGRRAQANRFDLSPLIALVATLHGLEHRPPKRPDPLAQPPLFPDPHAPSPELLSRLRAARDRAIRAACAPLPEPEHVSARVV